MANEAAIIELLGKPKGRPIRYTCAEATGIAKGTLLKMTDPRTAITTSADNDPFAGICAMEKTASDGTTTVTAYTCGIFDIVNDAAAAILIGERVSIKGANVIAKVAAADLLFADVGIALEAADKSETIAVLVGGHGW